MSYIFAIISSLIVAGLMLWILNTYAEARDTRRAFIGFAVIMIGTGLLGFSGILEHFERRPPPFIFFLLGLLITAGSIIASPWGLRVAQAIPWRVLLGLQMFRLLPEVLLDLSWREGFAPIQMTWHGRNFDIFSAALALLLITFWRKLPRPHLWALLYNIIGLVLLFNIVSIAVLSSPVPFRVFMNDPANTFVATFPYIWLPSVHVLVALVLHGLALRRLKKEGL